MNTTWPTFRLSALALWLGAAFAGPVQAQSLVELYDAARGFDASYQSARAQYDSTQFRAEQSRAGLLPQAGLTVGVSRTQSDATFGPVNVERYLNNQNLNLSVSQPLYRPANLAVWEQSRKQLDVAREVLNAAEQDLIVRTSQTYFDVLTAQDTLAFVRAQKAAVAEQLASAKRNFEVGTSTITDSREAQARYDLVTAQEIAAENDLRVKQSAIDQLVGKSSVNPKPLALPAALPELLPNDINTWVRQSEDNNPAVRQSRSALEIARLETERAKAGHKPTLDLTAAYTISRNPNGSISTTSSNQVGTRIDNATVGLQFNLPLFAGFATQNRLRETLALEDKAQADLDAARRTVAQSTRTAFFGVLSGQGQVKALEAAEASSQSALDANKLGYQVGVRINIDVLNAQSQLFQTKRDLAVARYNVLLGGLRLRQANGTLTPEDLLLINSLLVQ
ncbi:TolC family outer membrane protein [Polaromonas sp.]|uniref:TolC family outer membrane protein n=1 Tax=Polaromonas sp. TaxID=1869339 RepID=UPI003561E2B6